MIDSQGTTLFAALYFVGCALFVLLIPATLIVHCCVNSGFAELMAVGTFVLFMLLVVAGGAFLVIRAVISIFVSDPDDRSR